MAKTTRKRGVGRMLVLVILHPITSTCSAITVDKPSKITKINLNHFVNSKILFV